MQEILESVRVLDLTQGLAGAYCTMNLGDFGAEVIKVEPPSGDYARRTGPMKLDTSALFCILNRNKKSVCIDYTTQEGRALLLEMARTCDVLVESFPPGQMAAWGLGYDEVKNVNPGIIYASLTGFGQTGPLRDHPADDLVAAAMSGLMDRIGRRGEAPMMPGVDFGGAYAGTALLSGIAMALYHNLVSGEGTQLEVSVLDCIFYMLELFVMNYSIGGAIAPKNGNQDSEVAPLGTFATKDGYAAIAISSEGQWKKFCNLMGLEHMAEDPRFSRNEDRLQNLDALINDIEAATVQWEKEALVRLLSENKLAAGALKTLAELVEDPQALATQMILRTESTEIGAFYQMGNPMKLGRTPVNVLRTPAPLLGQHTTEIMASFGFAPADDAH